MVFSIQSHFALKHRTVWKHEDTGKESMGINTRYQAVGMLWSFITAVSGICPVSATCEVDETATLLSCDVPATSHTTDLKSGVQNEYGESRQNGHYFPGSSEQRGTWLAAVSSGSWTLKTFALSAPSRRRAILSSYVSLCKTSHSRNTELGEHRVYALLLEKRIKT